jgi:serine protease Do
MIQRGELAEGIGFAIPINEARKAAEELRASGSVKRGYLGITMNPTGINEKSRAYYKLPDSNGVLIASVTDDGPGAKAGLRKNDLIRKIDGNPVKDNQDLLGMIASRKPGETVTLELLRDGETKKLDVKLSSRPVFGAENEGGDQKPEGDEAIPSSGEGLGIKVQALSASERQQLKMDSDAPGVVIKEVDPESDAAEEGLTPRELITAINDKPVRTVADWKHAIGALRPGDTVKVDVLVYGGRSAQNEIVFLTVPKPKSN